MNKILIAAVSLATLVATPAFAHSNISVGIGLGGPTYYAPPPPVYYAPPPVAYYPPPAPVTYYTPYAYSYYAPRAYYGGYYGPRYYHGGYRRW